MSGDHNMNQTDSGWRKRQIALDKKAENARELGLDYEPSMTKNLLPTLIQQIELYYNESKRGQASPAELVGVSLTLFLKRGTIVSMETMGVTDEIDMKEES